MPSLPVISGSEAVRALQRLGFAVVRQRGSHVILRKGSQGCVVPNHREIKDRHFSWFAQASWSFH